MQGSWIDSEAPKGAPGLETSDVETSQKRRQCVLTTRRPCRFQNQQKSEAKALMKLIFFGVGRVGGTFLLELFPSVCFCPVRCLEQRSLSVQKSEIFTQRNAEKGLFFFFLKTAHWVWKMSLC